MNADLTMVNESSQNYFAFGKGNVQKVSQVIANVNAGMAASTVAIKDKNKETMELETMNNKDSNLISNEPTLILNVSPT